MENFGACCQTMKMCYNKKKKRMVLHRCSNFKTDNIQYKYQFFEKIFNVHVKYSMYFELYFHVTVTLTA